MKKIAVVLMTILLLTVTLFRINSAQLLKKLTLNDLSAPVTQTMVQTKLKNQGKGERRVRIVILNESTSTPYYSSIKIKNQELSLSYGKKLSGKKKMNGAEINPDSKYFKKNSVVKIEAPKQIELERERENRNYPGSFYIYKTESGLVLVNDVDLEQYVAAVISSEIGVNAPKEALNAQAVCARTYIINAENKEYKKFDAVANDSTEDQVYNAVPPTEKCKKAAENTKNLVMTCHGKPVKAFYFSTSCGYTTNYRIWGKEKLDYLKGCQVAKNLSEQDIRDEQVFSRFIKGKGSGYEKEYPYFRWETYLSANQIENAVFNYMNVNIGNFLKAEVNSRGVGGIASQITIYGDERQVVINNQTQIRKVLSSMYMTVELNDGTEKRGGLLLPSAFISLETIYDKEQSVGLKIYGGGFGHGSGMSQNGAIEMAKSGADFQQILEKFYAKIELETLQ